MTVIHFVDVETSGTTDSDEILDCAIVAWRDGQRDVRYNRQFFCSGLMSPEAAQMIGYKSKDEWGQQRGATWMTANDVGHMAAALNKAQVLAGFAPSFQRRMLFATFRRMRIQYPQLTRSVIDVASLAAPFLFKGLPDLSSDNVCKLLGIPHVGGNALNDCHRAISVFEALTSAYWKGLGNVGG